MNLHVPASPASVTPGRTTRAMSFGQQLIAVVVSAVGIVRAVSTGTHVAVAVAVGLAIMLWYAAGSVVLHRRGSGRGGTAWLGGLVLIWVGAVAISPEFVWVAFLLWLLAGHLLELRWGLLCSLGVLVVVILAPALHQRPVGYANVLGPLIGAIFAFGLSRGYVQLLRDAVEREALVRSLTAAQAEMALLHDELALAQWQSGAAAERTRIARDIHDTIAQGLSSIRLLAHAGTARSNDPEAVRVLEQIEVLAAENSADVRRIVQALAPAELEDGALTAALRRMLDRARQETGLRVQLHVDESLPRLPSEVEVALLRTAQSALGNVRLHADATTVVFSVIDDEDTVRLDMIDDGKGFDAQLWERETVTGSSSYGLRFMRARLSELGGGLEIESTPGDGVALSAHLPIRAQPMPPSVGQRR